MISVLDPGPQTTVQDLGRPGFYAMGLPPSGAMDQYSHRCSNLLVGNADSAAALEITMAGPTMLFHADALIAVTGADTEVLIDGHLVETWTAHQVRAGHLVSVGLARTGARSYLAVRGGVEVPMFLGSRSTYTAAQIGGLSGGPLAKGDELLVGEELAASGWAGAHIDSRLRPALSSQTTLRVVPGLCNYRFTPESLDRFFGHPYIVTAQADRIGCRLDGPHLNFVDRQPPFGAGDNPSNVVDLGYPVGSIQVPNGVEPICLLRDAVTGGGYATLGTIISADLDLLAQARAPDEVLFEPVGIEAALAAREDFRSRLRGAQTNVNLLHLF